MSKHSDTALATKRETQPFSMLREMTTELDRMFADPFFASIRWPSFRALVRAEQPAWMPKIEVFEREHRLVTRIDLPGMKKDDVKVEVTDGNLTISGERKREKEDKTENMYRCEREYGSFYRAVPLPEGIKMEDVKATFVDGVLEVSVPMPVKAESKAHRIEIEAPVKA